MLNASVTCATACLLWVVAVGIWLAAWRLDSPDLRTLSIMVCGGAVTATIRSYFVAWSRHLRTVMQVTGQGGRVGGPIHPLRR